jgi:beta-barrel assembly-enhancing protease
VAFQGRYFDGQTARDNAVSIDIDANGVSFWSDDLEVQNWSFAGLAAVDPPRPGHLLRLRSVTATGARLSIRDDVFLSRLLQAAPHLRDGFNSRTAFRMGTWIAGGLTVLAALVYFTVNFAPQRLAVLLPDKWTQRVGEQIETGLVDRAKICHSTAGDAALSIMVGKLAEADPNLPPLRVRIYDMALVNAFTLPGGRIVLTRGLIEKADGPDEVAGVLAHELGHAVHHDPEAQLVRITGVQILLSVATGTSGGTNAGSIAGLAAILQSSREAERAADAYAVSTLTAAYIDPLGLKQFFEKILIDDGKNKGGPLARLGGLFATHPGTEERISLIKPLTDEKNLKPVLTDAQWQDLRRVCG